MSVIEHSLHKNSHICSNSCYSLLTVLHLQHEQVYQEEPLIESIQRKIHIAACEVNDVSCEGVQS